MYYAMTSAVAVNFEPIYQDTKMVLSDEPVKSKLAASSSFWYCCLWRSRSIHLIGRVWPLRTLRCLPVCRKTYKTMMKIFPKEIIATRWHCSMTVLPILHRNNRDSCFKLSCVHREQMYCTVHELAVSGVTMQPLSLQTRLDITCNLISHAN